MQGLFYWLNAHYPTGFDCSISNGSHWHGDHTVLDNPTAANVKRWHSEFARVAVQPRGSINIINSRQLAHLLRRHGRNFTKTRH